MNLNSEDLRRVFEKTSGGCYYCRKRLSFENHGKVGSWGSWEVDHKIPKAQDGSDDFSNLIAACYACNRDKRDQSAVSYRRLTKPERVRRENMAIAKDVKAAEFPLATFAAFGLVDIFNWFGKRKREKEAGATKPVELKDLPWFGIGALVLVVVIVYSIFRAHRGS